MTEQEQDERQDRQDVSNGSVSDSLAEATEAVRKLTETSVLTRQIAQNNQDALEREAKNRKLDRKVLAIFAAAALLMMGVLTYALVNLHGLLVQVQSCTQPEGDCYVSRQAIARVSADRTIDILTATVRCYTTSAETRVDPDKCIDSIPR